MQRQTFPCSATPNLRIQSLPGDLQLAGWDREELSAKTTGDTLSLRENNHQWEITCDDDLIVYLPRLAQVNLENISGDADLRAISGPLFLQTIGGDFQGRSLNNLTIHHIGGDFDLRHATGLCSLQSAGGDVSIKNLQGSANLNQVGGDLYIREMTGGLNANVDGDAILFLTPAEEEINLQAQGDIILRLPLEASITLHLRTPDPENLRVNFPNTSLQPGKDGDWLLILGQGRALGSLTCQGDLVITCQDEDWQSFAEFGPGSWEERGIPPIPPIPGNIGDRISHRIERATSHIEEATRRAEEKLRANEQRARIGIFAGGSKPIIGLDPRKAEPLAEPVSDQERLAILQMLQDKKITLPQAEALLAALEGK